MAGGILGTIMEASKRIDAVVIAKGAPVKTSSGEVTMCAIAVSELLGLIRFYPLKISENRDIKLWSKVDAEVVRSDKDNRHESWKVFDYQNRGQVENRAEKNDILESCVLKSGTTDPIRFQNENKCSIAVVKTKDPVGFGLLPRDKDDLSCYDREEHWCMTQDNYPLKPYLFWRSIQGVEHKTHLLAQEVYMGLLKNCSAPFRVFENLQLGNPDYDHWIILGNMKNRRSTWVAPHLHRLKKTDSPTLLNSWTSDGRKEGWPYLKQEGGNAKDAGLQMMFAFTTEDTI